MALAGPAVYIFFSKNLFDFCMYNVDSKFFLLFSAAFALAWLDGHRPRSMFLAGLFAGMAAFSYQALLAVAGVELVLALLLRNKTASPGWVKPLALFGAGFALVGLGVLLYLAEMRVAEEFFQTMLSSGGRKGYIWDLMLTRVFPVYLLCVGLTLAAERLRTRAVPGKIAAALVLAASLSLLYFFTRRNPLLFPHLISMLTPVVLFTVSGYYLVAGKSPKPLWFCWVLALAYFMVSMASGLDGGHAMSASLLLIPWTGYVLSGWQKTSRVKVFRLSPEGLLLLLFLLAGGFYSYLSRWELHGAAEPLYLCSAKMELPVARGIYTSPGQKQELETMVKKIDQFARPGQKILVYPHYHLIYVLARRLSCARGIWFSGELHDVNDLKAAAEKALAEKSVVVFQLENGKIFQPLASPKADAIIKNLSGSCTQKIWLQNYLLCPL
jgi:hypothetical protein